MSEERRERFMALCQKMNDVAKNGKSNEELISVAFAEGIMIGKELADKKQDG